MQRWVRFSPAVSHPHGNFLTLQRYLLSSVISSGYPVFPCHSHTTVTRSVPPGSDSFFLEVFLSFFSLESGNDNSLLLTILSPNTSPIRKWCYLKRTGHAVSSGLHPGCSLCWETSCPDISWAHSLTSFKALLKCHLS